MFGKPNHYNFLKITVKKKFLECYSEFYEN